jgi:hypothetical protein
MLIGLILTLGGCTKGSLSPYKMTSISEISSISVFGKGHVWDRSFVIEDSGPYWQQTLYTYNISDEDYDLLHDDDTFKQNDILNIGLLTPRQKVDMKRFINITRGRRFSITLGWNDKGIDTIVIRCLDHISDWKKKTYNIGQAICFPLEVISNQEIINHAKEASNVAEITMKNLGCELIGIFIHNYENLSNNQTKIKFFYISLEGNLFWFDIIV